MGVNHTSGTIPQHPDIPLPGWFRFLDALPEEEPHIKPLSWCLQDHPQQSEHVRCCVVLRVIFVHPVTQHGSKFCHLYSHH